MLTKTKVIGIIALVFIALIGLAIYFMLYEEKAVEITNNNITHSF